MTEGAKMAYNELEMGTFHLLGHPKCSKIILANTFLTHF